METLRLLLLTVLFRPYVFLFLAVYLYGAVRQIGAKKAVIFTLIAWAVAYVCEFSSVRTGFPFGLYHYIPSTKGRELWVMGVPFMDSLSFTFLSYSSWRMARVFLPRDEKFSWKVILLGAFLMTLLDVVIDPLALRGDRWFLGKIYYYSTPGPYFGVTVENFVGWFFVGAATMRLWKAVEGLEAPQAKNMEPSPVRDLLGPALYFVVLLFNLSMTFWIGETALGLAGVGIFVPVTVLFGRSLRASAKQSQFFKAGIAASPSAPRNDNYL